MKAREHLGDDLARELARAFDRSFAAPPRSDDSHAQDFLSVGVGGDAYAVRLSGLTGLVPRARIVPVPSSTPEFMGVTTHRSGLVPVYELALLLEHAAGEEPPGWLLLAGKAPGVGLALDHFHRHIRVPAQAVAPVAAGAPVRAHVTEALTHEGMLLPVLDIALIMEDIERRVGPRQGATR